MSKILAGPKTRQLAHQISRTNLMFQAYQHDLSPRGRELASLTSKANEKLSARQYSAPELQRVQVEVIAHLPDPSGTNLLDSSESSWLNWFTISGGNYKGVITDPIGDGCLEPCSFCERGNISGWSRDNPLYVVAAAIRNSFEVQQRLGGPFHLFYQGVFGNNVIEWLDPFFHFDIGSLATSLAMLDSKITFAPIIKAFNADDPRTIDAAKRLSGVNSHSYSNSLILSFHLGIGSSDFDIIRSISDAGGNKIPEEIIDHYAKRYAMNFRVLGSAIRKIFMYGIGLGIRSGEISEDIPFDPSSSTETFNWATRQALLRAVSLAGLDIRNLPFSLDLLDRRPLHTGGRGFDFVRRFDSAFYRGEYLEADSSYGQDLTEKPNTFTRVNRKSDGTILVVNPDSPQETMIQTTMDVLWPE